MADINLTFGAKDLKRVVAEIQKAAKSLNAALKKTGTITTEDAAKAKKLAKSAKLLNAERKKLNSVDRERIKIAKQLDTVNSKLALANSKEARTLAAKKKQLQAVNRQLLTGARNTNKWGTALGSFQFKFNALGNIAASAMAAMTRAISQGIRSAIKNVADFDQAMADVQSITRATKKDFDALSKSARALGGVTKFTATEVAKLQKEYAKLGFSTKEIINAQAATLDLAAATGTELARSAEVVGITIRQFGFNAKEAGRVTDVMARSFTSSALDMEKFAEAMKFVGPAARASGISIERTTAILGQLADAGISGSMAGTSLRQIMLALSKESGTFSEKIQRAADSGLDLAGAADEVQKRAATALLVLADGSGTIDDFTESLENAGGAAQEMAEVQLETLRGKATILTSAWQGMTQAMLGTEENAQVAKGAIGGLTRALNAMQLQFETGITFSQALFVNKLTRDSIKEVEDELSRVPLTLDNIKDAAGGLWSGIKQFGKNIWEGLVPPKEIDFSVPLPDVAEIKDLDAAWNKLFTGIGQDVELDPNFIKEFLAEFDFVNDEVEKLGDEQIKFIKDALEEKLEAEQEAADEEVRITQDKEDRKKAIIGASFEAAGIIGSAFVQMRIGALDAELNAVAGNAEKLKEVRIKQAKERQAIAVKEALINTAVGIGLAFAQYGWPAGIIPAALTLASGVAQVAVIKSQQFAEGEVDIKGKSHSRGGIPAEIEGGESVINKKSTSKYKGLLEAINQDDQVRIMDAMSRDRKITINRTDPYTQKMYDLMKLQVQYGQDNENYYKHKGNITWTTKKE